MSSSTMSDSLSKAYRLIEADELAAARAVIEPLVASEPNNADAWWLYAHAVTDTFAARHALDEVLRINPNYPGAAELMSQLEVVSRTEMETEPVQEDLVTTPDEPEPERDSELELEDAPDFADEFDEVDELDDEPVIAPVNDEVDLRETVNESQRRSWVPIAALVAVVAIALLAALLLLNPGGQEPDNVVVVPSPSPEVGLGIGSTEEAEPVASPTLEEAELPTEAPAVETEPVVILPPVESEPTEAVVDDVPADEPTEEAIIDAVPTDEPTEDVSDAATEEVPVDAGASAVGGTEVALLPPQADYTPLVDALSAVSVATTDISEAETDLGSTVVVTVCANPGATLRQNLPAVMDVIASRAVTLAGEADAIGARIVNCETERPLIFVAVPKERAVEYAVGNLTVEDFQSLWHPQ